MIDGAKVLALLVACVLTDNLVFSRFFGGLAAYGERPIAASAIVGAAAALVLAVSSIVTSALYFYVLTPLKLVYLSTALSVVIIAAVFCLVNFILKDKNPLRVSEPTPFHGLVALMSAFLGAALLGVQAENFAYAALTGVFYGTGLFLAVVVLAGVRERLQFADAPESLKGLPLSLVSAGLIALALMGFSGFGS